MKILVGIKHVPDTETKIKIGSAGTAIDPASVSKWIMSPFDEYALEQGLRTRDDAGEGEVVLVCAGPESAQQTLRQGLAMGADRAVLVTDDRFDQADGLVRARALAAVVKEEAPELVLLGKYGVGTDEGQTGAMLGELLNWPHTFAVSKLDLADGQFTAEHLIEGAVEVVQGSLPAVITCEKGLNEPRYPSLKGIMQAKKKPIAIKPSADVGIDDAQLAQDKMLIWEALELPPERGGGKILDGDPGESAAELVRLLNEEAKVI